MTDNTQPRPSKESMEEAGILLGEELGDQWEQLISGTLDRLTKRIAFALDYAKAEGAERVVMAVETACGVGASFARSKDWTIGFDDARGMTVAAARQALQEEKGE